MPSEGSTVSHTPTPWKWKPEKLYNGSHVAGRSPGIYDGQGEHLAKVYRLGPDKGEANAARIVACVNALEGWEDPADVAELVEAAQELRRELSRSLWGGLGADEIEDSYKRLSAADDNLEAVLKGAPR